MNYKNNVLKKYSKSFLGKRKRKRKDIGKGKKKSKKMGKLLEDSSSDSSSDDDFTTIPKNFFFGGGELFEKGNHIWFNTSVTKSTTNKLVRMIHNKNADFEQSKRVLNDFCKMEPQPIHLHINSYGGDLLACMAVIDAIRNSTVPVYTIIEGCAASAATLISVFGKKRLMTANSYMLIHQLSSSLRGKMNEIEDDYINNKVLMTRIKDIYESKTRMDREEITKALKHDLWWDAQTCLDKGLIDEIM